MKVVRVLTLGTAVTEYELDGSCCIQLMEH